MPDVLVVVPLLAQHRVVTRDRSSREEAEASSAEQSHSMSQSRMIRSAESGTWFGTRIRPKRRRAGVADDREKGCLGAKPRRRRAQCCKSSKAVAMVSVLAEEIAV